MTNVGVNTDVEERELCARTLAHILQVGGYPPEIVDRRIRNPSRDNFDFKIEYLYGRRDIKRSWYDFGSPLSKEHMIVGRVYVGENKVKIRVAKEHLHPMKTILEESDVKMPVEIVPTTTEFPYYAPR